LAVPETWPVKANDAILPGKKVYEAADREVLHHGAVAMEKHDARRSAIAPL